MVTPSGVIHTKTKFSFSRGASKHFTGNGLRHSTVTFHNLSRQTMSFTCPKKKKFRRVKSGEWLGGQGMGPLFLSNYQQTPYPERHENDGWIGVVHHVLETLLYFYRKQNMASNH